MAEVNIVLLELLGHDSKSKMDGTPSLRLPRTRKVSVVSNDTYSAALLKLRRKAMLSELKSKMNSGLHKYPKRKEGAPMSMSPDPTRNIRIHKGELERSVIIETERKFSRTPSGKSWKSQPESETEQEVTYEWYHNIFDAIPFLRGLGGTERVSYGYTYAGYLPVEVSSISPDRNQKIVRSYRIKES